MQIYGYVSQLWLERNKCIFRKESHPLEIVLQGIESAISEVTNSSLKRVKVNPIVTHWDSQLVQEWKLLFIPNGWIINPPLAQNLARQNN